LGGLLGDRDREGGEVETIVERPAALDVHKAQVTACVRVPGERGRREQHVAEFPTTVRGLWRCETGSPATACNRW
jgi:hypothetical protein